ncbi:MAG: phosphotransferase [Bdellovibrionota bacterium]
MIRGTGRILLVVSSQLREKLRATTRTIWSTIGRFIVSVVQVIPEEQIKEQIRAVIGDWSPAADVADITPLTPDASLRRYFRVTFESPPSGAPDASTILAMHFDSVACPEVGSGPKVDSDFAYVELSKYLASHGVAVPELLHDARTSRIVLIEDLGDRPLAEPALRSATDKSESLAAEVTNAFLAAIDEIAKIQQLPDDPSFFAFQRGFNSTLYQTEMSEFLDYLFLKLNPAPDEQVVIRNLFETLGNELEHFPQVLVHRDFHAWNLMLDRHSKLRVIDFQDALKGTGSYDLVSLLNDRDMDSVLGGDRYRLIIAAFRRTRTDPGQFAAEYDRVLLQRDLKVAGRFAKLSALRGLRQYERWIPGTVRRIGSTLERLTAREGDTPHYGGALDLLQRYLPDVRAGAERKFRIE